MNALDQAWGVLKEDDGVPFSDLSDEELADSIERTGRESAGGILHGHLMMLAYQRMKERDSVGRAGIISQMERALNEQRKKQGEAPFIVAPRKIPQEVIGEGLDFPPNFNRRKLASADAFTSAWDVVKQDMIRDDNALPKEIVEHYINKPYNINPHYDQDYPADDEQCDTPGCPNPARTGEMFTSGGYAGKVTACNECWQAILEDLEMQLAFGGGGDE